MRAIVDALVSATNMAILVRAETGNPDLKRSAECLLYKLEKATERVVTLHRGGNDGRG